ncbi:type I restriction-modification enzyme R subunit C-terminal domain-containing protein [Corynebacterium aurimucosum]|uniref:type I restriction-modification enzyme R subunit C-terminal domain-containing protein n=1 Tax=Corynebacterium aurimucosum TaxID=169292 RepID=UPI0039906C32
MDRDTRKAVVMDLADELGNLVAASPALEEQLGVGLPRLVRTVIGLDESAARSAFADMMDGARLNSVQLAFMNQIIGGLVHNGIVTVAELFESTLRQL